MIEVTIIVGEIELRVVAGVVVEGRQPKLWFAGVGFKCYVLRPLGTTALPSLKLDQIRHLALLTAESYHIPLSSIHDFGRTARHAPKKNPKQLSLFDNSPSQEADYD